MQRSRKYRADSREVTSRPKTARFTGPFRAGIVVALVCAVASCAPAAPPVDCASYRPGEAPRLRLVGESRARLLAAQAVLAPGFTERSAVTGLAILAEYQAEMERERADNTVAAIYLATVSTRPVTVGLIHAVNSALCVAATAAAAEEIAGIAEPAREAMQQ